MPRALQTSAIESSSKARLSGRPDASPGRVSSNPRRAPSNLSRAWRWASKACLRRCSGVSIGLEYTSRTARMAQKRARAREQEMGRPSSGLSSKPKGPERTASREEVNVCRNLNPRA